MKECLALALLGHGGGALKEGIEKLPKSHALMAEMVDEGLIMSKQLVGIGIAGY